MIEFLQLLRDILRLRRGPEDMPYAPGLLVGLCLLDLGLQWSFGLVLSLPAGLLPLDLIKIAILFAFIYLVLMFRGLTNRFLQTAIAVQSCAILFTLLLIPAVVALAGDSKSPVSLTPTQSLLVASSLPISIWAFIVHAHIFRRALSVSFARGFGVATAWYATQWILAIALHGAVQTP